MDATPLYLVIILAQANAYSYASATLHLSGNVQFFQAVQIKIYEAHYIMMNCVIVHLYKITENVG